MFEIKMIYYNENYILCYVVLISDQFFFIYIEIWWSYIWALCEVQVLVGQYWQLFNAVLIV